MSPTSARAPRCDPRGGRRLHDLPVAGRHAHDLTRRRAAEVDAAAAVLGLAGVDRLGLPDGEVTNDVALRARLVALLRAHRPDLVVAPDPTAVFFGDSYVNHRDHREVGWAALDMVAARRGMTLDDAERDGILLRMRELPPHPEVPGALAKLADAGFRLASLTNSPPAVMQAQLDNAGLAELFDARLSVEDSGSLKPAPVVYRDAAARLGVAPADMRLIAAHAWDVTGAIRAGCAAAFVARPGMVLDPLGETPDVVGRDLDEVADRILAAEQA